MRRFRFGLESYLGLLRQQQELAESALSELRSREAAIQSHGDHLVAQRDSTFATDTSQRLAVGEDLAALDRWRSQLAEQALRCRKQAEELLNPIAEASSNLARIRQRAELVAQLRERRRKDHQKQEEREAESSAAELFIRKYRRRPI